MEYKRIFNIVLLFVLSFGITFSKDTTNKAFIVGTPQINLTTTDFGTAVIDLVFEAPYGGSYDPQIGLSYSSQKNGYGLAGYGIDVTGISVITRGGKNLFDDKIYQGITYTKSDNYFLDGKRLILETGEQGADGAVYSLEGDPFTKITLHYKTHQEQYEITPGYWTECPRHEEDEEYVPPVIGSRDILDEYWFEVTTNTGETYQYGKESNSILTVKDDDGFPICVSWYVNLVEDKYSNEVTYDYIQSDYVVRPKSIKYGLNRKHPRGIVNSIDFSYRDLGKNSKPFVLCGKQGKMDCCLSTVTTKTDNEIYRKYTFSYDSISDQGYRKWNRLDTIFVENGKGEKYPPVSLNWTFESASDIQVSHLDVPDKYECFLFKDKGNSIFSSVDFNGDGYSDIVRISETELVGSKTSANIYISKSKVSKDGKINYELLFEKIPPEETTVILEASWLEKNNGCQDIVYNSSRGAFSSLDFDGDGYNDYLIPYFEQITGGETSASHGPLSWLEDQPTAIAKFVIIWGNKVTEGDSQVLKTTWEHQLQSSTYAHVTAFDVDGDGKDEVVALEPNFNAEAFIEKFEMSYHCFIAKYVPNESAPKYEDFYFQLSTPIKRLFTGDYNNDGLTDLFVLDDEGYTIIYNNGGPLSSQTFSNQNLQRGVSICNHNQVDQGDFNGDGQIDFVYSKSYSNSLWVAYNNGNGTFTIKETKDIIVGDEKTKSDNDAFTLLVWDANHDGLSDVFYYKVLNAGTNSKWILSTGNGFVLDTTYQKKADYADAHNGKVFLGDFDGDGYPELANCGTNLRSTETNASSGINIYKFNNCQANVGRITSVEDGMGNRSDISYLYATNPSVYSRRPDPGVFDEVFVEYPVNIYTRPIPVVSSVTSDNGYLARQTTTYKYKDLLINIKGGGVLGFNEITKANDVLGVTETTEITQRHITRWLPCQILTTKKIGDKTTFLRSNLRFVEKKSGNYFSYCYCSDEDDFYDNTVRTYSKYDHENGVLLEKKVENYPENLYKIIKYSDYSKYAGVWLPKTETVVKKHKDDSKEYTISKKYNYNSFGDITCVEDYSGTPLELKTYMDYDEYGNVKYSLSEGLGVPNVATCKIFDKTGRFVKATQTNPSSSNTVYVYDKWGNVLSEETTESKNSKPLIIKREYDGWGQLVKKVSASGIVTRYETEWGNTDEKKYYKKTIQDFSPIVIDWYDKSGRHTQTETNGADNLSIIKSESYDSCGNVTCVCSKIGNRVDSVNYTYDRWGRVLSEKSTSGNDIVYSYDNRKTTKHIGNLEYVTEVDGWGKAVKVVQPSGTVTYKYSSLGKPSSISSNGSTISFEYDAAGNKIYIKDPDAGETYYEYGADGNVISQTDSKGVKTTFLHNDIGQLAKAIVGNDTITYLYNDIQQLVKRESKGNSVEFLYDDLGHIISEKRVIKDVDTLLFQYEYEGDILVKSIYPGGLVVTQEYDNQGFLKSTKANGKIVFSPGKYDGIINESSCIETLKTVQKRDERGYISNRQVVFNNTLLEKFAFDYQSQTGNLLSRTRNDEKTEEFVYDQEDRLISASTLSGDTLSVEYDVDGNILHKSDVGDYSYTDKNHAHAVSIIDKPKMLGGSGTMCTAYNDYGKIERIELGTSPYCMDFTYGPDMERWMTTVTFSGRQERTTIYAGDYEKSTEKGVTREYYFLDGNVLVIKQDSVFKYYFAFTDNLGSILSVIDEDGNKVFDATYDVWGKQTISLNEIGLHRGYTGHEMLNEFGIINMNGRLYDPIIGRFCSPDDYVQEPSNPQSFNRYSYCLNNPLKYTDQNGEYCGVDDLWAAITGGCINLGVNICQGNLKGHGVWGGIGRGFAAFGAGAVQGVGSLYPEFGGWIWGGAVAGGTNAWLSGAESWEDISIGAAMGAATSVVGGAAGEWAAKSASSMLSSISNPVLNATVSGAVSGAAAGAAGGFLEGWIYTGSFSGAIEYAGQGMLFGMATGSVAGGISGYRYAKSNHINPWTGKPEPYEPAQPIRLERENHVSEIATGESNPHPEANTPSRQEIRAQILADNKVQGMAWMDEVYYGMINSGKYKTIQREVTMIDEGTGCRIRMDIVAIGLDESITFVECKSSPTAGYTKNQTKVFPNLKNNSNIIPVGKNAQEIWGIEGLRVPTNKYHFIEKRPE